MTKRSMGSSALAIYAVILATGTLFVRVSWGGGRKVGQSQDQSDSQVKQENQDNDNKDQKSTPTVKLRIEVASNTDKPISNASVYVRFSESGGLFHHDKLAELSLKTNQDGTVKVPEIPQGRVLVQVVAIGWHTYGKWYDVNTHEEVIRIKLDPPPHWY